MAVDPINSYYQCWYPWTGAYTGQPRPMSYWIQFPNPDAEMPVGGWPVLLMFQGGSLSNCRAYHTFNTPTTGGATVEIWRPDNENSPYYTHPAICIIADTSDYDEWLLADVSYYYWDEFYTRINYFGGMFSGVKILRAVVDALIAGTLVFYDDESCTTTWTELSNPIVDADRIYASGYSYGGGAMMAIARDFRDVIAGMVMGAGWPIGLPYRDYYYDGNDFDYTLAEALKRRVRRMYHIPLLCHGGNLDGMYRSMSGLLRCFEDVEKEKGTPHKTRFAYVNGVGHDPDGWIGWSRSTNKLVFDPDNPTRQEFQTSGTGLVNAHDWLFGLTKPQTPTDPYPNTLNLSHGMFMDWGFDPVVQIDYARETFRFQSEGGQLNVRDLTLFNIEGNLVIKQGNDVIETLSVGQSVLIDHRRVKIRFDYKGDDGTESYVFVECPKRYALTYR